MELFHKSEIQTLIVQTLHDIVSVLDHRLSFWSNASRLAQPSDIYADMGPCSAER